VRRLRFSLPLLIILTICAWPAMAHAVTFGASVDGDFINYERGLWTWPEIQTSLRELWATGATVARTSSDWSQTEAKRPVAGHHRYNWAYDDLIVAGLAMAHLRWEPMLGYTPKWAQQRIRPARDSQGNVSPLPPRSDSVYGDYVAAFARRYGVGGSFWAINPSLPRLPVTTFEIWNEPDERMSWGPDIDLQDYAKLYKVAYRAIKRVDQRSSVITGGLAFPHSTLSRLLRPLAGFPIDGVAVHTYVRDPKQVVGLAQWASRAMPYYGRGRTPLIDNEFGWSGVRGAWQFAPKRKIHSYWTQSIVGLSKIRDISQIVPFGWPDSSWGLSTGGLAAGIKQARGRR